jgi:osomolarity two-component system sensor histidine kinase TcsA
MDISMPVINSYKATVRIRNSGIYLPIIAITAYALKGDIERYLEKGIDDYITKLMNRQLLIKKLLKWLIRPDVIVQNTTIV